MINLFFFIYKLFKLDTNYTDPYINLGNAYRKKGELDSSYNILLSGKNKMDDSLWIKDLKPGTYDYNLSKSNQNIYKAGLYTSIGKYFKEIGKIDKAEQNMIEALKYSDKYPEAYFSIGLLYYDNNKIDEALKFIIKAKEMKYQHAIKWLSNKGY